jgi:hypothetical protein
MQTGALSIRENGKVSIKSIERSLYFFQPAQAKWHDAVPFSKEKKSSTSPKRGINFSKKLLKSKKMSSIGFNERDDHGQPAQPEVPAERSALDAETGYIPLPCLRRGGRDLDR